MRNDQIGKKIKEVEIQPLKIPSTKDPDPVRNPDPQPVKAPEREPVKV